MSDPPPFDPSKPFTTGSSAAAPPPFDPSKPFTTGSPPDAKGAIDPYTGAPQSGTETTPAGIAASLARGAAPIATGAALGAAAGAPFAGIGAVPGAAIGATAAGLTELSGDVYNAIAPTLGLPHMTTPYEATGKALDVAGIRRPQTGVEHAAEFAGGLLPFGAGAAKTAATAELPELIASGRQAAAQQYIDRMYSKAVGPSTRGRDTALTRREAMSEIIGNKADLRYADPEGKVIASGRLPESLDEFGQAIDQGKSRLFNEWDALAKSAGEAGTQVDLRGVAKGLREYASDPSLLRNNPEAAAHARAMAERYEKDGLISPKEAQQDLVHLNQKLRGYFAKSTPIAPAEEEAARGLRQAVDSAITNATGPGWQELRRRYGSLRSIEDDVDRATRRVANWRAGGGVFGPLMNFGTLMGAAEGVWHGDIKGLAAALTAKGLGEYMKARQHPNAIIKRIFQSAEKYHRPQPSYIPPSPVSVIDRDDAVARAFGP